MKIPMLARFSAYGFLKNQQYYEPFLMLVFIEKGLSLLNRKGRMGYIAPSLWLKNEYGLGLRQKVKREGAQGNRKSISIIQQNEKREEVKRWQVFDAWPSKFTGPELDASSSDNAVESVEIQHEGLDLVVKG